MTLLTPYPTRNANPTLNHADHFVIFGVILLQVKQGGPRVGIGWLPKL